MIVTMHMHMKQISLVVWTLLFVVNVAHAQTPVPSESRPWNTFTVKGENFSVALPTHPAMHTSSTYNYRARKSAKIRQLGAYADGAAYTIYIIENPEPQQPLDEFVEQRTGARMWDLSTARDINLEGVAGTAVGTVDKGGGVAQFFAAGHRLYEFVALGASEDDARVKKFLSSISLKQRKESVVVSDGPGVDYEPLNESEAANWAAGQKLLTGKEVDRRARLAMKPEPSYTESARRHGVTGVVVLKCVFASNGTVTSFRIVSDLPDGLTDKAIEAAKKIKFIPAIKDGKYVSIWMQLEYNFNLY